MVPFRRILVVVGFTLLLASASLLSPSPSVADWIVNGDFEDGNTGFSSDYAYVVPPGSENILEGQYTVWTNPKEVHSKWTSMGDHTTGHGKMLLANGAGDSAAAVWRQEFPFSEGITYEFSAWATGVYPAVPATLAFEVAGMPLGTLQLTQAVPGWRRFSATFTAVTSGPGDFVIRDLSTAAVGNDFALDDISLVIIPEPTTAFLLLLLGASVSLRWRRFGGHRPRR